MSTSKQMPICVQELHSRGLEFPVLVGGAAINRDFGRRMLYPGGKESDDVYEPGVFYCKDAFQGLDTMDALVDDDAREALVEKIRGEAKKLREKPEVVDDGPPVTDDSVRSSARTDAPVPEPPFWGVRELEVDLDEVYPHLDRHVLFKLHWGGRGVKGEEWERLVGRGLPAAAGADVAPSRTTCARGPSSATSRATPTATSWWSSTPRTAIASCRGSTFPRQPAPRPDLPGRLLSARSTRASATWWRSRA